MSMTGVPAGMGRLDRGDEHKDATDDGAADFTRCGTVCRQLPNVAERARKREAKKESVVGGDGTDTAGHKTDQRRQYA